MNILPDWVTRLPLQQQAVLIAAVRGPDGFPKEHGCKPLLRCYRAFVMASAREGVMLEPGRKAGSYMSTTEFVPGGALSKKWSRSTEWSTTLEKFVAVMDEMPLHWFTHFMHGAQVLCYKHPEPQVRAAWRQVFDTCCEYLHAPPESEEDMDERLCDYGRYSRRREKHGAELQLETSGNWRSGRTESGDVM